MLSSHFRNSLRQNITDNNGITVFKIFILGRYIVGYMVINSKGAVKRDSLTYNIQRYTSQNGNFEYGYPHFNALLQFHLELDCCKLHKAARHPSKCDIINDVKLFPNCLRYPIRRHVTKACAIE